MENFQVYNAELNELPIVVDFPHSGTMIPKAIQAKIIPGRVLPNVDWFLPELYDFLLQMGVTMQVNNLHRYLADPNRDANWTDLTGDYRYEVVYSQTTFGKPIYQKKLSVIEIKNRLHNFYQPYHQQLQKLLDEKLKHFEKVYLLDLHSFAVYPHLPEQTKDVVLGNHHDTSSSREFRQFLTEQFEYCGYSVSNNHPFSGGYITPHYGQDKRIEAMQIELAYHMYIEDRYFGEEELKTADTATFTQAKTNLQTIFANLLERINM